MKCYLDISLLVKPAGQQKAAGREDLTWVVLHNVRSWCISCRNTIFPTFHHRSWLGTIHCKQSDLEYFLSIIIWFSLLNFVFNVFRSINCLLFATTKCVLEGWDCRLGEGLICIMLGGRFQMVDWTFSAWHVVTLIQVNSG